MGKKKGAANITDEDTLPLRGKSVDPGYDDEKREKYEDDPKYRKSRVALAIFNILTLVIGVVFLLCGIVVLAAHSISLKDLEFMLNFNYVKICSIILIVLGVVLIVVSIVGLIGTIKFSKFMLNAYAVGVAFVCAILLFGGALLVIFRGKFASDSLRYNHLKNAIVTKYRVHIEEDPRNRYVTEIVDYIQQTYECCGAYGNVSSENSWAIYKMSSKWYTSRNDKFPMVPESCCVRGGDLENCQGRHGHGGPPLYGPAKDCLEPHRYINDDMHKIGCFDAVKESLEFYVLIFGIALMALPFALILLSSCCACRVMQNAH